MSFLKQEYRALILPFLTLMKSFVVRFYTMIVGFWFTKYLLIFYFVGFIEAIECHPTSIVQKFEKMVLC